MNGTDAPERGRTRFSFIERVDAPERSRARFSDIDPVPYPKLVASDVISTQPHEDVYALALWYLESWQKKAEHEMGKGMIHWNYLRVCVEKMIDVLRRQARYEEKNVPTANVCDLLTRDHLTTAEVDDKEPGKKKSLTVVNTVEVPGAWGENAKHMFCLSLKNWMDDWVVWAIRLGKDSYKFAAKKISDALMREMCVVWKRRRLERARP